MEENLVLFTFNDKKFEINHNNLSSNCLNLNDFDIYNEIGQGSFQEVYKAKDLKSNKLVALKTTYPERNVGFSLASINELCILKSISHRNIIKLINLAIDEELKIYLVMDFCEFDLNNIIKKRKIPLEIGCTKNLILQLLNGIIYLHENNIVHRDLKLPNLLLNKEGVLKIIDFNLSKKLDTKKKFKLSIGTLWYVAPELLLGLEEINFANDIWSIGCILGELILNDVLFKGKSEIHQVNIIFSILGNPNEQDWPNVFDLPFFDCFTLKESSRKINEKFNENLILISLIDKLLCLNPVRRITASDAIRSNYFSAQPFPWNEQRLVDFLKTEYSE